MKQSQAAEIETDASARESVPTGDLKPRPTCVASVDRILTESARIAQLVNRTAPPEDHNVFILEIPLVR
jgi:hypothetical protein